MSRASRSGFTSSPLECKRYYVVGAFVHIIIGVGAGYAEDPPASADLLQAGKVR